MNKKGFTLIELIVVIIIVGILAAVAVPMMTGNLAQARRTEAIAALGTIRTAERAVMAETSATSYVNFNGGVMSGGLERYIGASDLNGTYYNQANYSVVANVAKAAAVGTAPAANLDLVTGASN